MKPISLEIKGFQSFRDLQIIDFTTLTSKGLFGIFGPTGSGKSTILDAIMYALYGKVSKESQNEYINLNESEAFIRYAFALGSGDQHRHFVVKRMNKKNAANKYGTANVTLSEIITNPDGTKDQVFLGEKVREVNELVEELIGLKVEDFTRAVVLPQGKFSEFLKIEPSKRNEMLERIFGLEKYGKRITDKIKEEVRANKQALETKEEILARYEDVSDEKLKKFNEEFSALSLQENEKEESQKDVLKKYEEAKAVRELQKELSVNKENERLLGLKAEEFMQKEGQVIRAKQAAIVLPVIKELIDGKGQLTNTIAQLEGKKKEEQKVTAQHEVQQKVLENAKSEKEAKTPGLLIKQHELEGTIQDVLIRNDLTGQFTQIQADLQKQTAEFETNETNLKLKKEEKAVKEEELGNKKSLISTLEVSTKYRNDISQGVDLQKAMEQVQSNIKEFEGEQGAKQQQVKSAQEKLQQSEGELTAQQQNLQTIQEELEAWKAKPVWSHEEFQNQQKIISDQEVHLKSFKEKQQKWLDKKATMNRVSEDVQKLQDSLMILHDNREKFIRQYNDSKARYENLKINNYAGIIAEQLGEDDPCPVCGNVHKIQLAVKTDRDDLEQFEQEVANTQQLFDDVKLNIATLEAQVKLKGVDLQTVSGEFETLSVEVKDFVFEKEKEKLEALQKQNQDALQKKNEIEGKRTELSNEIIQKERDVASVNMNIAEMKTSIFGWNTQIQEIEGKLGKAQQQLVSLEHDLKPLQVEYSIENFGNAAKDIKTKDLQREKAEAEVKKLDREVKELIGQVEKLQDLQKEKEKQIQEIANEVKQKNKELADLNAKIFKVCGDRDAASFLQEVKAEIKKLEQAVTEEEEKEKKLIERLKVIRESVVTLENTQKLQGESVKKLENRVQQLLIEHSFRDGAEVKAMYLDDQTQKAMEDEIAKYKEQVEATKTLIRSVLEKLKGRSLAEEEWTRLIELKDTLAKELEQIKKDKTGKEKDIERMKQDLTVVRELNEDVKKLKHRQNMLDELNKLMRGNSFIEFISFGQLKYVAREASNRLMEITKGKFSLILSEETKKFLIQDHTSGGYTRSTDTLSGGELFLTSLSLALALSTHIQLKNSAPLEFFFLDEGFGTLDDTILDTAMNSLEKLHSDRLSVGIISHVKEIQERVPVKLLVTAASSGVGSKVRLEYS